MIHRCLSRTLTLDEQQVAAFEAAAAQMEEKARLSTSQSRISCNNLIPQTGTQQANCPRDTQELGGQESDLHVDMRPPSAPFVHGMCFPPPHVYACLSPVTHFAVLKCHALCRA